MRTAGRREAVAAPRGPNSRRASSRRDRRQEENITDEIVPAITEDADRSEASYRPPNHTSHEVRKSYAVGGTGSREGENEDNSKHYSSVSYQAYDGLFSRCLAQTRCHNLTNGKLTPPRHR